MNKAMVLGIVRHLLTTAGGVLVARGLVDDSGLTDAVGAICTLVGVGWSMWEKSNARTQGRKDAKEETL